MPIFSEMIEAGIVEIRISNPARRNALSLDMFEALAALWPRLAADPAVEVVVFGAEATLFARAPI